MRVIVLAGAESYGYHYIFEHLDSRSILDNLGPLCGHADLARHVQISLGHSEGDLQDGAFTQALRCAARLTQTRVGMGLSASQPKEALGLAAASNMMQHE